MCGRFVGFRTLDELRAHFPIHRADCEVTANFNVAPTQQILAIARREGVNVLDRYHWGLVPFWAKDLSIGYKMINARSESVATKPSFREALKKRRCLILADGFFEWRKFDGRKQPVFITLPERTPFAFAGLWETWHSPENPGSPYRSCTIITRAASDSMRDIHDRMPVILRAAAFETWLDPENHDAGRLQEILTTHAVTEFVFHPVSNQVNSARKNDPSNIRPLEDGSKS